VRVKNATRVDTVSVIQRNSLTNQGCQHKKITSWQLVVGESGGDWKQGLVQKEKILAKINKAKYEGFQNDCGAWIGKNSLLPFDDKVPH
jgi:hypothetical protein